MWIRRRAEDLSTASLPWPGSSTEQTRLRDTRELSPSHGYQPSLGEGFPLYFYKIFFLTCDALRLKKPWLVPTYLHSNNTKPLNYGLSYGRSSREEEKSVCPSLTIRQNTGSREGSERGSAARGSGHRLVGAAHRPVTLAVELSPTGAAMQCLFKTKQSSLKTNKPQFVLISVISSRPTPVPCECVGGPRGPRGAPSSMGGARLW